MNQAGRVAPEYNEKERSRMKLYFKPTSPYARKVRVVAVEAGLIDRITTEEPPLRDASTEFWRVNPTGMIPALITDDGDVVVESNVICEYIDTLNLGHKLFPSVPVQRWRALKLNSLADSVIGAHVTRVRENWRPEATRDAKMIELEKNRVTSVLDALEADDLIDDPLNIGHVTLGCALSVSDRRFPKEEWRSSHPRLAKWYEAFNKRESMTSTYAE
jgi:glutathione S-transferase